MNISTSSTSFISYTRIHAAFSISVILDPLRFCLQLGHLVREAFNRNIINQLKLLMTHLMLSFSLCCVQIPPTFESLALSRALRLVSCQRLLTFFCQKGCGIVPVNCCFFIQKSKLRALKPSRTEIYSNMWLFAQTFRNPKYKSHWYNNRWRWIIYRDFKLKETITCGFR